MEAKEILARTKQFFNDLIAAPTEAPAPVALMEYELKGGGMVTIDKLEVGGIVLIDGNAALPGEYELTDGSKMTVADNGAITAITLSAPTEEVAPEMEDMGTKFAAFESLTAGKFADYETKFSAYEQRFADYEVKMKKANKVIDELLKLSTLLVEAPTQAPDPGVRNTSAFVEQKKKDYSILFS